MEELAKPTETLYVKSASVGQPPCSAVLCALVNLLSSWNVKPTSIIGHTSGEIAAAYACGSLLVGTASTISYQRGFLRV